MRNTLDQFNPENIGNTLDQFKPTLDIEILWTNLIQKI